MPRTSLALDFPLGQPIVPAVLTRRRRILPAGAARWWRWAITCAPISQSPNSTTACGGRSSRRASPVACLTASSGQRQSYVTIEGVVTLLHGIVGVGGQITGTLALLPRGDALAVVQIAPGSVIIFPHQVPLMLMQRAAASGAAGIIAGSATARELEAFARTDLTLALDGQPSYASATPLTVVLTEGVGSASMSTATYQLLSQHVHDVALLDGATDPRRNLRPEVVLTAPVGAAPQPVPVDATIARARSSPSPLDLAEVRAAPSCTSSRPSSRTPRACACRAPASASKTARSRHYHCMRSIGLVIGYAARRSDDMDAIRFISGVGRSRSRRSPMPSTPPSRATSYRCATPMTRSRRWCAPTTSTWRTR